MRTVIEEIFCPMSPEQEEGYTKDCAERILRYNGFFLLVIIGIQIYNLLYTLIYTGGKLHTIPSRVYSVFYIVLILISVVGLILKNYLKKNLSDQVKRTVLLQRMYGFLLIAWGTGITIYDQRVSNNISVYLIAALTVAVVVYFTPIQAVAIYGFFLIVLYFMLPLFQKLPTDNYGNNVNITIMSDYCGTECPSG